MSDIDARLECLRIADGDVDAAREMYKFAIGKEQNADVAKPQGLQMGGAYLDQVNRFGSNAFVGGLAGQSIGTCPMCRK
jgi:hypothetical protein